MFKKIQFFEQIEKVYKAEYKAKICFKIRQCIVEISEVKNRFSVTFESTVLVKKIAYNLKLNL